MGHYALEPLGDVDFALFCRACNSRELGQLVRNSPCERRNINVHFLEELYDEAFGVLEHGGEHVNRIYLLVVVLTRYCLRLSDGFLALPCQLVHIHNNHSFY